MRPKDYVTGAVLVLLVVLGLGLFQGRPRVMAPVSPDAGGDGTTAPAPAPTLAPPAAGGGAPAPPAAPAPSIPASGDALLAELFRDHRSDVEVEAAGTVARLLADDRTGARHQRFIVRLDSGQTLLFAHNLDLAPRVPLARGDRIRFRGQYEWSDRGGVMHWTHRDPSGHHPAGWIEVRGHTYQ